MYSTYQCLYFAYKLTNALHVLVDLISLQVCIHHRFGVSRISTDRLVYLEANTSCKSMRNNIVDRRCGIYHRLKPIQNGVYYLLYFFLEPEVFAF